METKYKVLIALSVIAVLGLLGFLVWWFKFQHPYGTPSERTKAYMTQYKDEHAKINGGKILQGPLKYGVTTIITTAPQKSIPSDHVIKRTIRSLNLVPILKNSLVIIGFDGCSVSRRERLDPKCRTKFNCDLYDQYKTQVKKTARELLPNVKFIELGERHCLTELVYSCMKDVDTTFVNVMQQDLPYTKTFDAERVMEIMSRSPDMDLVRLSAGRTNKEHEEYTEKGCGSTLPQRVVERDGMTFMQCSQWSDQNHIAKISHYKDLVWDLAKPYEFMEHQLLCYPGDTGYKKLWYLGGPDDQYCAHTDGRNAQ